MNYFVKDAAHVTPTDLVELDYYRKLEFVTEITLHSLCTAKKGKRKYRRDAR